MKNKAINRRALAVYLVVCLLYVSVAFRVPEKLSMKRIGARPGVSSGDMSIHGSFGSSGQDPQRKEATEEEAHEAAHARETGSEAASDESAPAAPGAGTAPERQAPDKPSHVAGTRTGSALEPRSFIAVPITCYAIREGWVDKETLILSRKDGKKSVWLKPFDILREHDEDGIKGILNIIGKSRLKEFLKQEGITPGADLTPEEIMLGKGYLIEKKQLLALYTRLVPDECNDLFPLTLPEGVLVKDKQGFRLLSSAEVARVRTGQEESEWRMPNLDGLSIKLAIDKLAVHTGRIKVHGSGFVVDQSPRAFERLKGDSECTIYGRLHSE